MRLLIKHQSCHSVHNLTVVVVIPELPALSWYHLLPRGNEQSVVTLCNSTYWIILPDYKETLSIEYIKPIQFKMMNGFRITYHLADQRSSKSCCFHTTISPFLLLTLQQLMTIVNAGNLSHIIAAVSIILYIYIYIFWSPLRTLAWVDFPC